MKMKKSLITFLLSVSLGLTLLVIPASADTNDAILEARKGILQVAQVIVVDGTEVGYAQVGTGFLIGRAEGAQTVLTNYHVAHAWTEQDVRDALGDAVPANARIDFKIRVVVKRDVFINATIINESQSADFTILKLEQPLYDRSPLTLTDSDKINTTNDIYALGFPGIVANIQLDTIYTADDVTVTAGIISKLNDVIVVDAPIPCITHSARVSPGNSGGPLLTSAGYVIGINSFISSDSSNNNDYFYSIQINEIRDVLDALGVEYQFAEDPYGAAESTPAEESVEASTAPTEESSAAEDSTLITPAPAAVDLSGLKAAIDAARLVSLDGMTEDTAAAFRTALNNAETLYRNGASTQQEVTNAIDDIDRAKANLVEEAKGLSTTAIILIAVAAVVVIAAVVLIIVLSANKKKKKEEEEAAAARRNAANRQMGGPAGWGAQAPQQPQFRPQAPQQPQMRPAQPQQQAQRPNYFVNPAQGSAETSVLNDGAGETSVLNDGAGETTLLGGGAGLPSAYLVRKKNSERVTISKQVFKIGKERRRVDYCIADNSNISRSHADIIFKNGDFYLVDNHATNGTSINGRSIAAGTEVKLNNNDVIKLADEEFTFQK